jgi:uncharacterized protein YndB with AHSA1/START domain
MAMSSNGYSREITITRIFDAPRELVFAAWTDPKHLAQWFGPAAFTVPECRVDARPGGKYHLVMRANDEVAALIGRDHPCGGEYLEIVKPSKIVFTNDGLDAEGNVLLKGRSTVTFEDIGGGKTKMVLVSHASGTDPRVEMMLAGMEQGWSESFDKLAEILR